MPFTRLWIVTLVHSVNKINHISKRTRKANRWEFTDTYLNSCNTYPSVQPCLYNTLVSNIIHTSFATNIHQFRNFQFLTWSLIKILHLRNSLSQRKKSTNLFGLQLECECHESFDFSKIIAFTRQLCCVLLSWINRCKWQERQTKLFQSLFSH